MIYKKRSSISVVVSPTDLSKYASDVPKIWRENCVRIVDKGKHLPRDRVCDGNYYADTFFKFTPSVYSFFGKYIEIYITFRVVFGPKWTFLELVYDTVSVNLLKFFVVPKNARDV